MSLVCIRIWREKAETTGDSITAVNKHICQEQTMIKH